MRITYVLRRDLELTLDIAEMACLVTTRQRAAFPSPEKQSSSSLFPGTSTTSSETAAPPPTTTVEETQEEEDEFSQELIEEDTVIQSSLPQYLSHVYGCGPRHTFPGDNVAGALSSCGSVSANSSSLQSPVIAESQGFNVTEISSQIKISDSNDKRDSPTSAAKPESSTNTQSSPLLFDSPTALSKSSPTHTNPTKTLSISTTATDQQPPVSCPQKVALKTSTLCRQSVMEDKQCTSGEWVGKKRSRKRKHSATAKTDKSKYTCPPLCVSLADCTAMKPESLVNLFALVLQGGHIPSL